MQKLMRKEIDIVLHGRKRMNNEVDVGTLRFTQKTMSFLLQFEFQAETVKQAKRSLPETRWCQRVERCRNLAFNRLTLDWGNGSEEE